MNFAHVLQVFLTGCEELDGLAMGLAPTRTTILEVLNVAQIALSILLIILLG
jgi:hypothetical protein